VIEPAGFADNFQPAVHTERTSKPGQGGRRLRPEKRYGLHFNASPGWEIQELGDQRGLKAAKGP
jgi:hypothetical protein